MISPARITRIRSAVPSQAALDRSYAAGARTEAEAIDMAHDRRIEQAERHDRGEHYGAANYGRRVERFADCLTPAQRDIAGIGIEPLHNRPADERAAMDAARWFGKAAA